MKLLASADPLFLSWLLQYQWEHTALIKKSLLGLGDNKAGFLPAVPVFLVIARRSYSSNNFPCVVLVGWLLSIFVVQIAGGGRFPLTVAPSLLYHLNLKMYSFSVFREEGLLTVFSHCPWQQYSSIEKKKKKKQVTFQLALYWYLSS